MIVWIASYPRSGNTFARIVLNRIYGVPTYTVAEAADDLSYDKGAGDLTGNRLVSEQWPEWRDREQRRALVERLDADEKVYFIKTHGATHYSEHARFRAILIVRNAQDVFISFANYLMDVLLTWPRFWKQARGILAGKPNKWGFKRLWATARATSWAIRFRRARPSSSRPCASPTVAIAVLAARTATSHAPDSAAAS